MVVDRQYRHTRTTATRGDAPAPGVVTGLDVERAQVLHWPQHADNPLEPPPGEGEPSHRLGEDRVCGTRGLLCQVGLSCLSYWIKQGWEKIESVEHGVYYVK